VEDYYGVDVVSVNVINIPGHNRRNRRGIYFESGYRKAAVKIKKGQTIEAAATK
jgi:Ribosomal protein L23